MVSTRQVKAARALLAWSQDDLAQRSGVSYPTIARLEASDGELGGRADTSEKIQASLEAAGIKFIDDGDIGVKLKMLKSEAAPVPSRSFRITGTSARSARLAGSIGSTPVVVVIEQAAIDRLAGAPLSSNEKRREALASYLDSFAGLALEKYKRGQYSFTKKKSMAGFQIDITAADIIIPNNDVAQPRRKGGNLA